MPNPYDFDTEAEYRHAFIAYMAKTHDVSFAKAEASIENLIAKGLISLVPC
jgi:hypothetical protein